MALEGPGKPGISGKIQHARVNSIWEGNIAQEVTGYDGVGFAVEQRDTVMGKYTDEITLNLERTETNLRAARELLETGHYNEAAAHAADAAFCAASVLLLDEEIDPGEHGDIITLIQQIFVNGRRLTKEQGEKLTWLFQLGKAGNADGTAALILGEAQKAVEFAESFYAATKVILEA